MNLDQLFRVIIRVVINQKWMKSLETIKGKFVFLINHSFKIE